MNQRDRVRQMLEQAEDGVTTGDFLAAYLPRFSARIKELRDEGLVIETERISSSASRYRLRPTNQVTGDGDTLGGPETGSRAGGMGSEWSHTESSRRQASATSSGRSARPQGGGDQRISSHHPATAALPSLFAADDFAPATSHYRSEAV